MKGQRVRQLGLTMIAGTALLGVASPQPSVHIVSADPLVYLRALPQWRGTDGAQPPSPETVRAESVLRALLSAAQVPLVAGSPADIPLEEGLWRARLERATLFVGILVVAGKSECATLRAPVYPKRQTKESQTYTQEQLAQFIKEEMAERKAKHSARLAAIVSAAVPRLCPDDGDQASTYFLEEAAAPALTIELRTGARSSSPDGPAVLGAIARAIKTYLEEPER